MKELQDNVVSELIKVIRENPYTQVFRSL